jgi:protein SCO1/2
MKNRIAKKFASGIGALTIIAGIQFGLSPAFAEESGAIAKKPSCCSKELSASKSVSDNSIYQLDSTWTTDSGASIKLVSLAGRPQIVTMFFAKCTYACPILVNDMKQIEAALPENLRTNVGFVLVSFDSENDTVEALANYRKIHGLAANWTLLRGKPDDVLELGALLGVKFKKETSGQFAHSNVITLLDSKGEIVSQQMGLNRGPESTVVAAKNLVTAHAD